MAKHEPGRPTDWHDERYVEDLKRELLGAQQRGDEAYAEAVRAELRRFGAEAKKGPGRPRKETR